MIPKQILRIVLIAQSLLSCMAVFSVTLRPNQETCFAFKTPQEETARISGNFDVYDDDLSSDPITVVLFDYESEKVLWHSKRGTSEGSFALINSGKFHMCFGNGVKGNRKNASDKETEKLTKLHAHPRPDDEDDGEDSYKNVDGMDRTIGFQIRVEAIEGTLFHHLQERKTESAEDADTNQTMHLEDMIFQLLDKMELLLDHQEYIKGRESFHRHVVEQTFTMVMKWTVFETLILIFVASAQVFYLKRFFETKRFL